MQLSQTTARRIVAITLMSAAAINAGTVLAQQNPTSVEEVQAIADTPATTNSSTEPQGILFTAVTLPASEIPPSTAVTLPTTTTTTDSNSPQKFWSKRTQFTHGELMDLLRNTGFSGQSLRISWGIAMRESQGIPTAHNQNARTGDNSYGLFQINMIGSLGPNRRKQYGLNSNDDLFNPVINARVAYLMSGKGSSFGHWGFGPQSYKGNVAAPEVYRFLSRYQYDSRG